MSSGQGVQDFLFIVAVEDELTLDVFRLEAQLLKPPPQTQESLCLERRKKKIKILLCGRPKGPSMMTRYARSYSLQKGPSLEDSVE